MRNVASAMGISPPSNPVPSMVAGPHGADATRPEQSEPRPTPVGRGNPVPPPDGRRFRFAGTPVECPTGRDAPPHDRPGTAMDDHSDARNRALSRRDFLRGAATVPL